MFGRLKADGVRCRPRGDHAVRSPRLTIVAARSREYAAARQLNRDAQAQHWLGWSPDPGLAHTQHWLSRYEPLLLTVQTMVFVGIDAGSERVLTYVELHRRPDGSYEVGGMVDPDVRGCGLGTETLDAVARLAHQHFGIPVLRAGCETTNVASQRWLASCGFVRTDGPAQYTLPNGRVIDSLWWARVDPTARPRCRRLRLP